MPAVEHVELSSPLLQGTEAQVTWSMVDYHRSLLLLKCQGLDDGDLTRRAVPSSNVTLLGLLRHLTKVEHYWFQRCFLGRAQPAIYSTPEEPDADFDRLDETATDEVVARYLAICDESRAIARAHELTEIAALERDGEPVSLRFIGVHMVDEYARHLGHADLIREAIDGATGG